MIKNVKAYFEINKKNCKNIHQIVTKIFQKKKNSPKYGRDHNLNHTKKLDLFLLIKIKMNYYLHQCNCIHHRAVIILIICFVVMNTIVYKLIMIIIFCNLFFIIIIMFFNLIMIFFLMVFFNLIFNILIIIVMIFLASLQWCFQSSLISYNYHSDLLPYQIQFSF